MDSRLNVYGIAKFQNIKALLRGLRCINQKVTGIN